MTKIQRFPLCLIETLHEIDCYVVTPIESSKPLHDLACLFATDQETAAFVEYYTHAPYNALHAYYLRRNEALRP